MNSLSVGLVQQSCTSDREANISRSIEGIRNAAARGAQLVVLQELHAGPYFCQTEATACFDLAEQIPGPSTEQFGALARELGVVIVTSLFERRAPGLYHNTAVVLEKDGSIAGRYRKMHIPDDPAFYEKFYFTPGDLGFEPIRTSVGKLGLLVCWDQWYPEAARLAALRGAQVLFYPTAIGWHPSEKEEHGAAQLDAWRTVQRGHAVANGPRGDGRTPGAYPTFRAHMDSGARHANSRIERPGRPAVPMPIRFALLDERRRDQPAADHARPLRHAALVAGWAGVRRPAPASDRSQRWRSGGVLGGWALSRRLLARH